MPRQNKGSPKVQQPFRKPKSFAFTEAKLLKLPVRPERQYQVADKEQKGLLVLISPSGTRTYRVKTIYEGAGGKGPVTKLGRVGELPLEEAREKARELRGMARKGIDPRKGSSAQSANFKSAVEQWTDLEQRGRKNNVSASDMLTSVLNNTTSWHQRPVSSIRYDEIEELLHAKREVAPVMANLLHAQLRTFFRWATRTRRIASNPTTDMPSPWAGVSKRDKPWYRGDAANAVIRELWRYADKVGGVNGKYLKFLLLVGKRKEVTKRARWEDIDSKSVWSPPTKKDGRSTKRNHAVPLSVLARLTLVRSRLEGPLFEGVKESELVKGVRAHLQKALKITDFTLHDCRHLAETKTSELGLPWHIKDLMFDHTPPRGAGAVYQHYDYMDEMRDAFEKWSDFVEKVAGSKVTPIKRERLTG